MPKKIKRPLPTPSKNKKKVRDKTNYRLVLFILLVLITITTLIYSNSLKNDFVKNWDDKGYLMDNPYVQNFTSESIVPIFTSFYNANYHPLTTLSYALEIKKFGYNATPFHINNLILHILNVLLVFWLIQLMLKRIEISTVVALFFAIHPMHVESVAWISERKDLLYTFFYIGGLITYLYYLKEKKIKFIFFTFILFLLSLLSKSAAVSFPVMLLLFDYYYNRAFNLKTMAEKIPFFILSLVFGIAAIYSQRTLGAIQDMSPVFSIFDRLFLVSYGILFYIIKLFVPLNLSALHAYPVKSGGMLPVEFYLAPLVIGLVIFLIYKSGKFRKDLLFGTLFFLISIALVIQLIPVGKALTAERYSYVPYIGLFFIIGKFYADTLDGRFSFAAKLKLPLQIILGCFAVFLCVTTWNRNKVWENGLTLFEDVIKKNPAIDYAYNNRASAKSDMGDHKGAIEDFNKAISLNPVFAESWNNRGNEKYMLGKKEEALTDYNQAINIDSGYALGYFNRAICKADLNDINGAISDYQSAIRFKPDYPDAYYNLGNLKIKLQDYKGAISDFSQAIKFRPQFAQAYHNIGVSYYSMSDYQNALINFSEALRIAPAYVDAYVNRAATYLGLKENNKACNDWQKAISLGATNVQSLTNQYCK